MPTPKRSSKSKKTGEPKRSAVIRKPAAPRKRQEALARKFAIEAARYVNDSHCQDVMLLDIRGKSDVADFIVIGSGTSDRQLRSVGHGVAELGAKMGVPRYGLDRDGTSTWVALDFVDVIVHLFDPALRGHYDLEMLWGDAPQIHWRRKPVLKKKSK